MSYALALLMQQNEPTPGQVAAGGGIATVFLVIWIAIALLVVAGMWKIFTKAGEPGWAAIVPIYNILVLLKIAGKPAWWVVLMFIPIVNFIVFIVASIALARNFGKGAAYGVGLGILWPIFYPVLGFSDARYQPQPQS